VLLLALGSLLLRAPVCRWGSVRSCGYCRIRSSGRCCRCWRVRALAGLAVWGLYLCARRVPAVGGLSRLLRRPMRSRLGVAALASVQQCCYATALQCCCAAVPHCCSVIVLLCSRATMLPCCKKGVLLCCIGALQHRRCAAMLLRRSAALLQWSAAALQVCWHGAVQLWRCAAVLLLPNSRPLLTEYTSKLRCLAVGAR
jgi:hypothetical protein